MDDYLAHAAELLSRMEGFVSAERFSSLAEKGKLLSLSVWENEEAAAQWRKRIAHRESQEAGQSLFERYRIRVAAVMREYTDTDRAEAPRDSNDYFNRKQDENGTGNIL